MEVEDIEFEHYQDCLDIASKFYMERKYEEALEVTEDSGLDVEVYHKLGEIKYNCLVQLGQTQLADECLAKNCLEIVIRLIRNVKFKDALQQIENSGLDLTSHPKLLEMQKWCSRVLEEVPHVEELIKQIYKSCNANDYTKALALIDGCRFNHKVHLNLLEIKAYCLKKLGRNKEAFDDANYLWQYGYKMSRKLCQIIGDYLKESEGNEMAYTFYQSIKNLEGISNDDRKFYLKLMKGINRNK